MTFLLDLPTNGISLPATLKRAENPARTLLQRTPPMELVMQPSPLCESEPPSPNEQILCTRLAVYFLVF